MNRNCEKQSSATKASCTYLYILVPSLLKKKLVLFAVFIDLLLACGICMLLIYLLHILSICLHLSIYLWWTYEYSGTSPEQLFSTGCIEWGAGKCWGRRTDKPNLKSLWHTCQGIKPSYRWWRWCRWIRSKVSRHAINCIFTKNDRDFWS